MKALQFPGGACVQVADPRIRVGEMPLAAGTVESRHSDTESRGSRHVSRFRCPVTLARWADEAGR